MSPRALTTWMLLLFAPAVVAEETGEAAAGQPVVVGEFQDWAAYRHDAGDRSVCFAGTRPATGDGDPPDRTPWAMVTREQRPGGSSDVVSIAPGYAYRPGSSVEVRIGKRRFFLFTKDDTAWAIDDETDRTIVRAMRRGRTMMVTGTSAAGDRPTDRFSLMGFTKALEASSRACRG